MFRATLLDSASQWAPPSSGCHAAAAIVRSIFEAELESAGNAPAGHDAVYLLLLIGKPWAADFLYDVSPL